MITSFNMDDNPLASYIYFIAGIVSVIYAVSVFQARRKQRKLRSADELRPAADEESPVEDTPAAPLTRQEFVNDNPAPAAAQPTRDDNTSRTEQPGEKSGAAPKTAAKQASGSAAEDRELAQHGSGVASPAQPEAKP